MTMTDDTEERTALREATRGAFEKTDLTRLAGLCGYTEDAYEALLDDVAGEILSAGVIPRGVEEEV